MSKPETNSLAHTTQLPPLPPLTRLSTSHKLSDLLLAYIANVGKKCNAQPLLVLQAWPQVIGQFASMTRATRFIEGVLHVSVSNSTLLSLLSTPKDKARLVHELMQKVPGVQIKSIVFRIG